jgi:hypothetical protein
MSYTPSFADIPQQTQAYSPTYADIPQPSAVSSAISSGVNDLNAITLGLTRAGGNLTADIGRSLNAVGAHGIGQQLQNIGNTAANMTPTQADIAHPNFATSLISGAAQYAPYATLAPYAVTTDAISSIPFLGRAMVPAQIGALYGSTQSTPGNAVSGALENAGLNSLVANVPGAISLAGDGFNSIKNLVGGNLQKNADSLYNNISGGVGQDTLNSNNIKNIISNYNQQKSTLSQGYQSLQNDLEQNRGYATADTSGKLITPSSDTSGMLNSILENKPINSAIKNVPPVLQGTINQYLESPTFDNAHSLQSALGESAADFTSGSSVDAGDHATSSVLNTARNALKNDINNNFINNGDKDIANQYQNLSDQWKQNVMPYQQVPAVWRAIRGKPFTSNIINTLDDDDIFNNNQTIRNHLLQNPDQSQSVLAQALGKVAQKASDGSYTTDPSALIDTYNKLPDTISQFKEPAGLSDQIKNLMTQQSRAAITKNAKKWAIGGTAAVGISELAHKIWPSVEVAI